MYIVINIITTEKYLRLRFFKPRLEAAQRNWSLWLPTKLLLSDVEILRVVDYE